MDIEYLPICLSDWSHKVAVYYTERCVCIMYSAVRGSLVFRVCMKMSVCGWEGVCVAQSASCCLCSKRREGGYRRRGCIKHCTAEQPLSKSISIYLICGLPSVRHAGVLGWGE